ncbi:DUF2332 domain-containing protein [Desulfobulbus sp.]|uniref:DUF2332 domain-containing protein n=1 Tax=Desulfobulbus sp. TaxID=895 RepID=UPI00286F0CDC|nr:DUF2332 domain-containing protein [Desulfobulbus sp.]
MNEVSFVQSPQSPSSGSSACDLRVRLGRRFRKQQEFSAGYSPLYSRLFGLVADWLAADPGDDPLADWLVQAGAGRSSFDVPLLLLAGLHRDILNGRPETAELAHYYPTLQGTRFIDDGLALCLRAAVAARQKALAEFIATARVQTNETARGLCWLLPASMTGWPALHLVDLGASAGLNLVADRRHFRVIDGSEGHTLLELGSDVPPQFTVRSEGMPMPPLQAVCPAIRSRIGCDLTPLILNAPVEEQTLAAFVWGDHPERLRQLRAGIAALHSVNRSQSPVSLFKADLPVDLPPFLADRVDRLTGSPVILYNTYLTAYLADKGAALRSIVEAWASQHPWPVLWLQWEPLRDGPAPPEFGWLGWTADLWEDGQHRHWHLAWAHPHGTRIAWMPAMADWLACWRKRRQQNDRW